MPILILAVLGLLFGLMLSFASKKFYVEPDTRIEDITALLPGANCGACGFPGCHGLATAVIEEGADYHRCKPTKDFSKLDAYWKELKEKEAQQNK